MAPLGADARDGNTSLGAGRKPGTQGKGLELFCSEDISKGHVLRTRPLFQTPLPRRWGRLKLALIARDLQKLRASDKGLDFGQVADSGGKVAGSQEAGTGHFGGFGFLRSSG